MRRYRALVMGWMLYVSSFFLPVVERFNGWAAFRVCLERGTSFYPAVSALTNALIVITPLALLRRFERHAKRLGMVVVAAMIWNLFWVVSITLDHAFGDVGPGYYAWLISYAVVGVALWRLARTRGQIEANPSIGVIA